MSKQTKSQGDILIVDDMAANLKVLSTMLTDHGYNVRPAINGSIAIKAAMATVPDLILLDIMMPGMDGYAVCAKLREIPVTNDIPIIFVSALDEVVDKVKAFQVGGVDYITKPFQMEEVLARVENHLTIYRQRKEIEGLSAFKDLFIRTVSHDLGTPISNIMGYAEMLLETRDNLEAAQINQIIGRIHTSAERMDRLVSSMLDLTRLEAMTVLLSPMLLRDVLNGVLEEFYLLAANKEVNLPPLPDIPKVTINADPDLIGEVFQNLVSNGIKYTQIGGEVWFEVETTDDMVLVHVIDNGYGIPEEDIPYLFERFYRVGRLEHKTEQGSGLGLSIARLILERHKGDIWVESELGKGSRFTVSLPLYNLHTGSLT